METIIRSILFSLHLKVEVIYMNRSGNLEKKMPPETVILKRNRIQD